MEDNSQQEPKPVTVTISGDAAQLLEELAAAQGVSKEEILRRAIALESYLYNQRQEGYKVLLQKGAESLREVFFR